MVIVATPPATTVAATTAARRRRPNRRRFMRFCLLVTRLIGADGADELSAGAAWPSLDMPKAQGGCSARIASGGTAAARFRDASGGPVTRLTTPAALP